MTGDVRDPVREGTACEEVREGTTCEDVREGTTCEAVLDARLVCVDSDVRESVIVGAIDAEADDVANEVADGDDDTEADADAVPDGVGVSGVLGRTNTTRPSPPGVLAAPPTPTPGV